MLKIFAFITIGLSGLALLIAAFSLDLGTTIFALSGILIGFLTLNQQITHERLQRLETQIREIPKRQPPPQTPQQWDAEDVILGGPSRAFEFLADEDQPAADAAAADTEAYSSADEPVDSPGSPPAEDSPHGADEADPPDESDRV